MPKSCDDLFACFDALNIDHVTIEHAATHTVEAGRHLKSEMPGGHTKNLFMKDKDGVFILVSAWCDSVLKLNQLHKLIGTRRLSFASAEMMQARLGVVPGSVTAFALINDPDHSVRFVLDRRLLDFDVVNFHPLRNTATTAISKPDFLRFLKSTGHDVNVVDFTALNPGAE